MFGTDRRVVVLALARMADAVANSFLIVVLPLYIASGELALPGYAGASILGFPITLELLIGVALSLFGFLNSFAQPFTGRLSDRTSRRKVYILFGLAVLAVTSVAYALVESYEALVVVRGLQGLGGAFVIPTTIALVNDLARSDEERGGNFGVFNTFRLVGFGFGPVVAGLVVQAGPYALPYATLSGFDAAFGVAVVGALVSFTLVTVLIEEPPMTAGASKDLSIAVFGDGDRLLDPVFVLGVGTLFMAVSIALFATLQEPINRRLGQGPTWFGVQFSAVVIANIALQVPVGRAADRIGRKPFLLWGLLLLVPAVSVQGVVTSSVAMLLARLVHGVSVAMVFAPALAVAGDLAGEGESGTTLSVLTMAFGLGTAIGPLLSGALFGFGFAIPFAVGAVLAVVAFVLVFTQVEETLEGAVTVGAFLGRGE
ncbi:MFS transporter [Natronomonas sp. F2-12]|jgi:MFS family permease|uniref:MFS transporter n=1 Tax=Natronomonas aquatica TaxID=2841590 RepID=A0A9R1D6C4_9EURY|nr:MFS transporter [Natronomonas aquatica]MCQ4334121.1 MFS transporter [Natronomonas aquatica]